MQVQVDLTSQLVKVTHSLTIKNVGKVQTQQYAVCFPNEAAAQLSFLEVSLLELGDQGTSLQCLHAFMQHGPSQTHPWMA